MRLAFRYTRVDEGYRLATDDIRVNEPVECYAGRYWHFERVPERMDGGGDLHTSSVMQEYWAGNGILVRDETGRGGMVVLKIPMEH